MKRVTGFIGSARKQHTYRAVETFLGHLREQGDVETELVVLSHHRIGTCQGCRRCFDHGEEFCPLQDDRDLLIGKMLSSDGVVFASPTYSFQVSAIMKIFLDRLGFAFHRPRFFGKVFTSIAVQGIYGGKAIVKYLDFVGNGLGFSTVKGSCITSLEPMTEKGIRRTARILAEHGLRFHRALMRPTFPGPNLFNLMMFRWGRTSIHRMLTEQSRDFVYYRDHGWFTSDYFYPTRLGMLKRAAGKAFDVVAAHTSIS